MIVIYQNTEGKEVRLQSVIRLENIKDGMLEAVTSDGKSFVLRFDRVEAIAEESLFEGSGGEQRACQELKRGEETVSNVTNNEPERLIQRLPTSLCDFDYINNQEEKTDKPITVTTYNKPKSYLFVIDGNFMREINDALSFKDAVLKLDPDYLPRNLLDKFDDTDFDEIIKLFNTYSYLVIDKVYVIDEKIYDYYEEK